MYTLIYMSFPLIKQFYVASKEEVQEILDEQGFRKCDCQIYKDGDDKNPITSDFKFKSSY